MKIKVFFSSADRFQSLVKCSLYMTLYFLEPLAVIWHQTFISFICKHAESVSAT